MDVRGPDQSGDFEDSVTAVQDAGACRYPPSPEHTRAMVMCILCIPAAPAFVYGAGAVWLVSTIWSIAGRRRDA